MAKISIKKKPISNAEYNKLYGYHPLTDLSLNTGARITEIGRIIDEWEDGKDYVDVYTKMSGDTKNRFFLNRKSLDCIKQLREMGYANKSRWSLNAYYQKISDEMGFKFTCHNLRATFATRLLGMGVDLVTVQHLMHHAHISQTAKYISFTEDMLRPALEMFDDYKTFEGLNFYELKNMFVKTRGKIKRLEAEIERLKKNKI